MTITNGRWIEWRAHLIFHMTTNNNQIINPTRIVDMNTETYYLENQKKKIHLKKMPVVQKKEGSSVLWRNKEKKGKNHC